MKRRALIVILLPLLLAASKPATAQDSALSDHEKLGERLFDQSCVVCHAKPQITSGTYAPALSKNTLGGKADVMRDVISNGTPRMPGFKIQFAPAQIDAIAAYIKTIPEPAPAPPPHKTGGPGGLD